MGGHRPRRGDLTLGGAPCRPVPHVSLAVFEALERARVEGPLAGALTPALGLELTLGSLGFFVGETTVAFLGVAPTRALLEVHRSVLGALGPGSARVWGHYRSDALVPHCTLAMAVRNPGVVTSAVGRRLPIAARVSAAALVDVPTGQPLIEFAGAP